VKTEAERQAARDAYKLEARRAQAEYDNFRYDDAQRERTVEFIDQAMRVMRGDVPDDSLQRLLPVVRTSNGFVVGYDKGTRLDFDTSYLNKWTGIRLSKVLQPSAWGGSRQEPVLFEIDFGPAMKISRERLETLLQLKVVPGWTADGGNLRYETPQLHDLPPFNGGVFVYAPLKPPSGDFTLEVILTYLNGPGRDPYRTDILSEIQMRRYYLTPEQIQQRDRGRFGPLRHGPAAIERLSPRPAS
jgi:hypothetical protein